MRKNAKAAGAARERLVKKGLTDKGWIVIRSPASIGEADLIAMKPGRVSMMIQVKANYGSPYMNFRAKERQALLRAAQRAGAEPWLVHWPPNGEERWIASDRWPGHERTI